MKLKLTKKLPNKVGFYYWKDSSLEYPIILEVTKENNKFWATNEEFIFEIKKEDNEYWCKIPEPII